MCPACIANAALIVTGTVSAGGWTAFALRKPRAGSGSPQGAHQKQPQHLLIDRLLLHPGERPKSDEGRERR